jgi:hypothetical protein
MTTRDDYHDVKKMADYCLVLRWRKTLAARGLEELFFQLSVFGSGGK